MNEKDRRFVEELFGKQTEQFQQYVAPIIENFDHKLSLVAEGQQMLSEKMERELAVVTEGQQMLSEKIERVEGSLGLKIDKIATEVAAHRADTEAHHGVYRVKES